MKKVVSPETVAHMWANQQQEEARNPQGNFYFNGKSIYSYGSHFEIARHVTNDKGVRTVLFTEKSYSNTTAKHVRIVSYACNNLERIYVPNPDNSQQDNFGKWTSEAEMICRNLLKAKKPSIYLNQLESVKERAKKYAEFFGYEIPSILAAVLSISDKEEYLKYSVTKAEILKKEKAKKERHRR